MKQVRLRLRGPLVEKALSGEKRLTTRKSNEAELAPGEFGVTSVGGRPLYVRGRGYKTFNETLSEFGGLQAYSAAEGDLGLSEFPSGSVIPTSEDREWLISEWPAAGRERWLASWVRGEKKAYLYDLSPTPFTGQVEVPREHWAALMRTTTGEIPVVGPASPIQSLVATVWGLGSTGEYVTLWRSQSLSASYLTELITTSPLAQVPVQALRAWIERSAGLAEITQPPVVPYAIVVMMGMKGG